MPRIFINALSAKVGGGKTYINNLLTNMPKQECEIYIACPDKLIIPDDKRIKYLETKFANHNIFFRMLWELFYLPFLLLILRSNILFVPGGMDFTIFTFGIPKVTMFRNMLPFDSKALSALPSWSLKIKNIILRVLMSRTMKSADSIIFISNYARNKIKDIIKTNSYQIIPHGISEHFTPNIVPDTLLSQGRTKYILYVSRFEPYKNHLNLLRAYASLPDSLKKKYHLVLVGESMEPAYSECQQFVEENNLQGQVIFKGKVAYEDLPSVYKSAALFVYPSSCENCPNILLEAIGCGLPVIASKTEPMPEFAKDSALYFDENDYNDIAHKMNYVLDNPAELNEMRNKSIFLRENYTWEKTALKTWEYLDNIGGNNV
ncbi:glycosyltransferase family 4 protein [Escherichia coli]|uniref:glycosyltransferase family 4 protein n=2 Tax=Escherichia coli TaxID=562 RepID=UPI000BB97DA4|nr:glycosyltransferase family 1 protein [Escherichia coli]EFH5123037.1 glycosyltransferase [Escherichia coli]EJI8365430.1 glycosyltransferase family 4 protein [Escherichia coli]EJR3919709.1 glycosyltransferase family 4 protein [Escherichia coli]EJT7588265.1 glycosyltransferase family 4 protein [Escherichia coli]EKQ4414825.1 glycosyltransferase family 4 protein [Escherichia coli]